MEQLLDQIFGEKNLTKIVYSYLKSYTFLVKNNQNYSLVDLNGNVQDLILPDRVDQMVEGVNYFYGSLSKDRYQGLVYDYDGNMITSFDFTPKAGWNNGSVLTTISLYEAQTKPININSNSFNRTIDSSINFRTISIKRENIPTNLTYPLIVSSVDINRRYGYLFVKELTGLKRDFEIEIEPEQILLRSVGDKIITYAIENKRIISFNVYDLTNGTMISNTLSHYSDYFIPQESVFISKNNILLFCLCHNSNNYSYCFYNTRTRNTSSYSGNSKVKYLSNDGRYLALNNRYGDVIDLVTGSVVTKTRDSSIISIKEEHIYYKDSYGRSDIRPLNDQPSGILMG